MGRPAPAVGLRPGLTLGLLLRHLGGDRPAQVEPEDRRGGKMRSTSLITAATIAASLIAGGAGAASANAAAGSQDLFCASGYNTCLTWPYTKWDVKSRPYLTVDVYVNPYTANLLETSYDWTSPTFTNAGTYTVSGKAEPVSDINLGAPAPAGNGLYEFTCLSFTVNGTGATVYATYKGGGAWGLVSGSCM